MINNGLGITPQEYRTVISYMKRVFSRSQVRREVRDDAQDPNSFGPRGGKMYKCFECKQSFPASSIQVDHKNPVIPVTKAALDMKLDAILKRLWCKKSNLRVLCKGCHDIKSADENEKRRAIKKALKNSKENQ